MNASPETPSVLTARPPQLIQSLMGGFNAVANNIHLIILPVVLDLLLWFGPHLRLKELLWPFILNVFNSMDQTTTADMRPILDNLQQVWQLFLDRFNLFSVLSTFPLGLPSIMAGQLPVETPVGEPVLMEVGSVAGMLLGWLGLSLTGLLLGSLYLNMLARCANQVRIAAPQKEQPDALMRGARAYAVPAAAQNESPTGPQGGRLSVPPLRLNTLVWQTLQILGLVIVLFVLFLILMIPVILVSSFLALISLMLAQLALLLVSFSAIWFLVPAIFTPHGIFLGGQNLFSSLIISTRVVRHSLPGVGLFLLLAVVLYQGLGILWRAAPDSSWMALVGVFGHAFVSTGLLAASFVYYRSGLEYAQSMRKRV